MKKLLLTIIATVLMASSISAQKVAKECVLVEAFTGINCGYCPAAAGGIAEMVKQGLSIAPLAFHTTYYSPSTYATSETHTRGTNFYKVQGYPTVIVDGVSAPAVGGMASQYMSSYQTLKAEYDKRINLERPYKIELTYEYDSWNKCRAKAVVKKVGECESNDVRLFIALTESHIPQSWGGWNELNAVVRDIVTSTSGVKLVGDTEEITALFDVHAYKKENCELVAWVQNQDTNKEVFQAVKISIATEAAEYDLGISDIETVATESCSGKMKPTFVIKNHGSQTLTSAVFNVTDDADNKLGSYTWEGSLSQNEQTYFEIPEEVDFSAASYVKFEACELNGSYEDQYTFDNVFGYEVVAPYSLPNDGVLSFQLKTSEPENFTIDIVNMDEESVVETLTFDKAGSVVKKTYTLPEYGCYRIILKNSEGNGIGNSSSFWGILDSKKGKIAVAEPGEKLFRYESFVEVVFELLPPTAPVLTAESIEKTALLSWNAVEGAANYNVYQGEEVVAENIEETSYVIENLEVGNYCYTVVAANEAGESDASNVACVTIAPPVAPTLTAELSETTVVLTWEAVEKATSYNVYKGKEVIAKNVEETTYMVENLEFGEHCFAVTAVNAVGESESSNTACVRLAQECVLIEAFTGINCGYCPAAAGGIAEMVKQGLSIAPLAFHTTYYSPSTYATSETHTRGTNFYKVQGYPTVIVDGVSAPAVGGMASQYMSSYQTLKAEYDKRINLERPYKIELTYEYDSWNKCRAKAVVKKVGECESNDVRLFIALTESHIPQSWGGWNELNAVVRDIVTSTSGVKLVGDTEEITALFDVHAYKKENCELVAWVQNQDTNKEVFQAVKISIATEAAEYDLGISDIETVATESCSGKMKPTFVIKNHGSQTLTSAVFNVTDDADNKLGSYTWEGSLSQNEQTYFEIPEEVDFSAASYVKFEACELNGSYEDQYTFDNVFGYEVVAPYSLPNDGVLSFQLKTSEPENFTIDIVNMDEESVVETLTFDKAGSVVKKTYTLPEYGCYRIILKNSEGNGIGNSSSFWGILDSKKGKIAVAEPGEKLFRYESFVEVVFDGTYAVEDVVEKDVNVYPNPAKSVVNVYAENLNKVTVYNSIGQVVYTEVAGSDNLMINVESWTNGLYYINLETKSGVKSSQKVIVNK